MQGYISWIVKCVTLGHVGWLGHISGWPNRPPPHRDMYSLAIYVGVGLVDSDLYKLGESTPPIERVPWGMDRVVKAPL